MTQDANYITVFRLAHNQYKFGEVLSRILTDEFGLHFLLTVDDDGPYLETHSPLPMLDRATIAVACRVAEKIYSSFAS